MRRRHKCRESGRCRGSSKRTFKQQRRRGWDMNLYRNIENKKISGVCAGLADHFDVADWVVRLVFVAAFCFTGTLAIFAYLAAWCLMAHRQDEYVEETVEYDEHRREYRPKNLFRYSENVGTRIKTAQQRVKQSLSRIEDMESYVTSRQYQLNKEFSKLAD